MANKYVALLASRFSAVNTVVGPFDSREKAEKFVYRYGGPKELYTQIVLVQSPDEYECGRRDVPCVG